MVNGRPSRCFQMAIAALAAALLPCAVASVAAGEPGTLEVREVCAGDRPWVSPDGKVLAVVRGEDDPEDVDAHGRAARVSRVWFRDLATGDETKAEVTGLPRTWTDARTLLVAPDRAVDATTGKARPFDAPSSPEGLYTPGLATLPGGEVLVYVGRTFTLAEQTSPPEDRGPSIYIVRPGVAPAPAASKYHVNVRAGGWFTPAPDGRHVLVGWGFMRTGNIPNFRVAVLDVAEARLRFLDDAQEYGQKGLGGGAGGARTAAWDVSSKLVAYVIDRGGGYVDVHLASRPDGRTWQLTNDGLPKWQPALDLAGTRVAFWREDRDVDGGADDAPLKLVIQDVHTDRVVAHPVPAKSPRPSALHWSPDGRRLYYAHSTPEGVATFELDPGPPPDVVPDAPVHTRSIPWVERVIAALDSGNKVRIRWGLEKARQLHDIRLVAPLRRLLAGSDVYVRPWDVLEVLVRLDAASALPEVLARLETLGQQAFELLARWRPAAAQPVLETLAAKSSSRGTRALARITLLAYAQKVNFAELRALVEKARPGERSTIASALAGLRRPESVELLLILIEDETRRYTTIEGDIRVCDHAESALVTLTGRCFRADATKWHAWWKEEAKGALPPAPDPRDNPGRKEYDRWMQEREDAHQGRMRGIIEGAGDAVEDR